MAAPTAQDKHKTAKDKDKTAKDKDKDKTAKDKTAKDKTAKDKGKTRLRLKHALVAVAHLSIRRVRKPRSLGKTAARTTSASSTRQPLDSCTFTTGS